MPVEITCGLLKKKMEENGGSSGKMFLIDGYPRNLDNLEGWINIMGDSVEVPFIVTMDAEEETMI